MARIVIQIGAHLCTAPRPQKEAAALAEAGHDVTVAGAWFDDALAERDAELLKSVPYRFLAAADLRGQGVAGRFAKLRLRAAARSARTRYVRDGRFSPRLLGTGAPELLKTISALPFDLLIVHSEAGLWLGCQLMKQGRRVGVDFEDWFSRDLPKAARAGRPVDRIAAFERELMETGTYRVAASKAMANALARAYGVSEPAAVYNSFDFGERSAIDGREKDRRIRERVSLHWFSQTIGPGRGIETLMAALPNVASDVEIHLRGNLPECYLAWFDDSVPEGWADRIHVHPQVPNGELLSRIAEHDIGLAIESNEVESRDLTVTNKVFQYLLGGLAVIATETTGQREIFESRPGAASTIPCDDSTALAKAIDTLAGDRGRLDTMKADAVDAAREFDWKRTAPRIVELAERAIGEPV